MIAEDAPAGGGSGYPTAGDIRALTRQIGEVHEELARNRHFLWWVVGGLAVLALAVAVVADWGNVRACQATNRVRAEQVRLWDRALPSIVDRPGDPDRPAEIVRLRAQVARDFAPRDCSWIP